MADTEQRTGIPKRTKSTMSTGSKRAKLRKLELEKRRKLSSLESICAKEIRQCEAEIRSQQMIREAEMLKLTELMETPDDSRTNEVEQMQIMMKDKERSTSLNIRLAQTRIEHLRTELEEDKKIVIEDFKFQVEMEEEDEDTHTQKSSSDEETEENSQQSQSTKEAESEANKKVDDDDEPDFDLSDEDEEDKRMLKFAKVLGKAMNLHNKREKIIVNSNVDKDLPHFDGKPEEWISFKCHYERSTRKHRFDDSDNLYRLQKALKGSAMEAVKFLFNTPDNVKDIMESLEMEFGRPELIIESLIKTAESVDNPNLAKPETIVMFARCVQSLVVSIKGHKQNDYLNNIHLLNKLTEKLPPQLRREWIQWYKTQPKGLKNMETFKQWITIQKEMACEMVKVSVPVVAEERSGLRRQRGSGSVNAGISGNEENCVCLFCKKINHQLDTCRSFKKISLDDKWSFVKKERVCFSCLGGKHLVKNCPDSKPCGQDGCDRFHNKLLHADKRRQNPQPPPPYQNDNADPVDNANDGVAGVTLIEGADGPLGIVPVKIRGPNGIRKTFALLDSGASCSFIDEKLANDLGIKGKQKQYTVTGIMGKVSSSTVQSVNFDIAGAYKGASYNKMTDVNAVGNLGFRPYSVNIEEIKRKWPHLRKMKVGNIKDAVVEVLVGEDHGFITMQREVLFRDETAPVGKRTKLGWFVSGKIKEESSTGRLYHVTGSDDYLHQLIKESFSLDNFGVRVSMEDTTASTEDRRSLKICEDFYVNDVLIGEHSVDKTVRIYEDMVSINHEGNINATKRSSNSPEVMQQIPDEMRAAGEKDFGTKSTVEQAERMLTKGDQHTAYPEDLQILKKGDSVGKGKLYKLSPFPHKYGVIRLKGRIDLAQVSGDSKRPAILPPSHHFTELLIQQEKEKNAHQWQATILNNHSQRYRIVDRRAAVKRVSQHSNICRNKTVKPIIPVMGSLPYYQLASYQPAFTFNGVDVFGPREVTFGRHRKKRWGALFVCIVTRAIPLEVANGMSTDEMMLVFSRFIDCRGRPCHMFSDNDTNFVGAAKKLKEAAKTLDYCWSCRFGMKKFQGISWQFIPPSSPHIGGAWERMVKSVKTALSSVLKEKHPRDQTLFTALKSVENIVNFRPLTFISKDPSDPESLTPNHFLQGGSDCGPPVPVTLDNSDEFERKQWKIAQLLANQFWGRWTKEYLPELIGRQKWHTRAEPIRNSWMKAVVTRVFPGRDGQVRVVEVPTRDFITKKTPIYRRQVSKICPLGFSWDSGTTPLIRGRNVRTRRSKYRSYRARVSLVELARTLRSKTQIGSKEAAFSSAKVGR